jgi:hypothetical protein
MSVYRVGGNKSSQNVFPSVRPTLDLDFANSKTLDPRITFTRSSGGSYVGADGLIKYAGVNEARFDHDPETGESLGLLIEESKTNSIRNNTMVGAVVGTPGTAPTNWSALSSATGISRYISEIGIEDGIYYVDIFCFGTATSNGTIQINFESPTGISALTGQNWTASLYTRLITGTILRPFRYLWLERNSEGSSITSAAAPQYQPTNIPLKFQRYVTSRTLSGGTDVAFVTARIDISVNTGDEVYFTIRIGMPQLERGAFATSVIPTTTSTRTRAGESISITGKNFSEWYRQDEGTIFMDFKNTPNSSSFPSLFVFTDSSGPGTNRILVTKYTDIFNIRISDITGGITQSAYDIASGFKVGDNLKVCRTYGLRDYFGSVNGSNPPQQFLNVRKAAPPKSLNQLFIGSSTSGGSPINAPIKRFTYFPKRLPNEQLIALTR